MVNLRGFLQAESGTMTQMALGFVLLTIVAGGVSVDIIRHERARAQTQQALDACTANAAIVERPGTDSPSLSAAISACMTRAGAPITNVSATSGTAYKDVSATATGSQTSQFMQMINISSLGIATGSAVSMPAGAPGGADAAARAEVVLAYESSNTYTSDTSIQNQVRGGLSSFVTQMLPGVDANDYGTTITLLPYNNGVNLGTDVLARYNVTNLNSSEKRTNSNCIDVGTANYSNTGMSNSAAFNQMVFADLSSSSGTTDVYQGPNEEPRYVSGVLVPPSNVFAAQTTSAICPAYPNTVVRLPTNSAATLNTNITNAQFFGATRWDHGMHWAVTLLDPGTNAAIGPLLPTALNQAPAAYNATNLQKVIVFVNKNGSGDTADGSDSFVLKPEYTTGTSPIKRDSAGNYCIQHAGFTGAGGNTFWEPGRRVAPTSTTNLTRGVWSANCDSYGAFLTWPQVWKDARMRWVAWQLYARALKGNSTLADQLTRAVNTFTTTVPFSTQNTRFQTKCSAAKNAGITIYTVALEAGPNANANLATCATSSAHHFETSYSGFAATMRTIAQNIQQQAYSQ